MGSMVLKFIPNSWACLHGTRLFGLSERCFKCHLSHLNSLAIFSCVVLKCGSYGHCSECSSLSAIYSCLILCGFAWFWHELHNCYKGALATKD